MGSCCPCATKIQSVGLLQKPRQAFQEADAPRVSKYFGSLRHASIDTEDLQSDTGHPSIGIALKCSHYFFVRVMAVWNFGSLLRANQP